MYSLLRRRTMMMKPSVVPTERLIYQLNDYTCDGTINTFIDTGIKLLGSEYSSFRIEMEYDNLVPTSQATLFECRSFVGSPSIGLSTKVRSSPQSLDVCVQPGIPDVFFNNALSATLSIVCSKQACSVTVNGQTENGSGYIYHDEPLTIGGRYSSHLSNPDRFVQVHISYLRIYAIANEDYQYIITPLTFKCLTGGDLSIKNANTSYDRNFEYSLNGGAWTAFDLPKNTASKLIATLSPNDTISFRRDNDNFADAQFISDSNLTFDICGNLLSLQYGSAFNGQTELRNTSKKAFGAIFKETNVVDASKLMLTATTTSGSGYQSMFENCSYLISAPKIYANTISNYCCNSMFKNCVSLISAPELPATNISSYGCGEMFRGCTSLITPPVLPATTINSYGYRYMFSGCVSLTTTPELPATTLTDHCYQYMFEGCTSLTTAPELPATILAELCYYSMFRGCTSLTTAPELPATTLATSCYQSMFEGCTDLTVAPELPATTLAISCYRAMFNGCTSITVAPELKAQTLVETCYNTMFDGCSSLNYVKCLATDISASNCLYNWLNNVHANGIFVKESNIAWPRNAHGIPNNWTEAVEIEYLESSGTQYIDTGITSFKNTDILKTKVQPKATGTYFVTYQNPGASADNIGLFISTGYINFQYGNITRLNSSITINSDYEIEATNGSLKINGNVNTGTIDNEFTISGNLLIGAAITPYSGNIDVRMFKGRIYYFHYENSNKNIIVDFVPIRVGSVGYMLDLVSKQIFGNAGTDDFILGPDKTY